MHANLERRLVDLLDAGTVANDVGSCGLDGVHLLRNADLTTPAGRFPAIVIGRFHADCPDGKPRPLQCLVLPSALSMVPPGCAMASLGVRFDIDLKAAAEIMLLLPATASHAGPGEGGAVPMVLDDAVADPLLRLLQALRSPTDTRVLGPAIVREVLYRVMVGPQGGAVHAALAQHRHAGRVGKALRRIHADYHQAVDVPSLAAEAGMSVTAFHAHFKALTLTTPMQYLKSTRLRHARLLMARDGVSAACASRLVGYESCSQFSREFKRLFGRSPAREASALRTTLACSVPPSRSIVINMGIVKQY
ncbi:helix-turn-helix transcriptional regulator [Pseudoduganella albidiflava]|uniref:AraC family transcriptional regulator n=1 Tax=Pseudoduganella albidiflava TaxID=321983 RepID=A0A411WW05_9BURK|nr:AraC family transcriptional regulator [Pseudoduganella albidiflava]QBI00819.1 AraC family transcriptional regulator [Pseudoduganella albidiflava]GGY30503.1 AraC family transcriptional regulator [Pseudoduganella albidiflava]